MKVHGPMQGRPEITTGTERKNLADFSKNGKSAFLMRPQLTERSDVSCLAEFTPTVSFCKFCGAKRNKTVGVQFAHSYEEKLKKMDLRRTLCSANPVLIKGVEK